MARILFYILIGKFQLHTNISAKRTTFFGTFSKNVDVSSSLKTLNEFERKANVVIRSFS